MNSANVLVLPGWKNAGPDHWLSRWEAVHGYQRVEQHDWQRPLRGDWIARLEDVVLSGEEPAILVAHGLGCLLVAAWASHSQNTQRVGAALLVAPLDVEQAALRPLLNSWAPIPKARLPFKSVLVADGSASLDCSTERLHQFATDWGAELWTDDGLKQPLVAPGAGEWPQGQQVLQLLVAQTRGYTRTESKRSNVNG